MTIKKVASFSDTKYIACSSFLFSLPALMYIPKKQLLFPSFVLFSTSLISANYWRNALYDWRRNLDICCARLSFAYFLTNGFYYISWPWNIITTLNTGLIGYCFYKSNEEHEKQRRRWVLYHMGFHAAMAYNVHLVLYYMSKHTHKAITAK